MVGDCVRTGVLVGLGSFMNEIVGLTVGLGISPQCDELAVNNVDCAVLSPVDAVGDDGDNV